jgi:hypothetical protein
MATRYKDRLTILEDAEIEDLYGRPRFTHDDRLHYFALTPQERAMADGHYSLASRVLFILQAGYFKAKTLFFSFTLDEVADDVTHILQQHYPQPRRAPLKSAAFKQTRHTQQRKLLKLYNYHACVGAERAALIAKANQVVRISAKPLYVFQALVQYLETHRVVAPGYSFLQDVVSRALRRERVRLTGLLEVRLDEETRKALDQLYLKRDAGYALTPLKQEPKDFSRREMRREMARARLLVAARNSNRSDSQSVHFPAQINCDWRSMRAHVVCARACNQRPGLAIHPERLTLSATELAVIVRIDRRSNYH